MARTQRRELIECLQHHTTEEEALLYFIQRQRRTSGLNDFTRILLALELAPWFKTQALSNQKRGGQLKASSNLTEAERVSVRAKIAEAAGFSLGHVTKVKQLQRDAHAALIKELGNGEQLQFAPANASLPTRIVNREGLLDVSRQAQSI